jgi:antitoxin component of MazEF toxin-antitoxin module
MTRRKKIEPLTGEALLTKVKQLEHLSKEEKAKECGYYTITKNGVERVNMMKFLNALIDANEIQLDGKQSGNGRGGRSASYRITVQANGNLLIGAAYTKQMDLRPGDEFEISLGRKHIRLKQIERDRLEDEDDLEDDLEDNFDELDYDLEDDADLEGV